MFLRHIVLNFLGFLAGTGIAAGTFAFLLVIRVIPRMIRTANLKNQVIFLENIIMIGLMTGTFLSFWKGALFLGILGKLILVIYGFCAGLFVGCIAIALAEILDTFPIIFRRTNLCGGLETLMFAMAFGKMLGSFFYFWFVV